MREGSATVWYSTGGMIGYSSEKCGTYWCALGVLVHVAYGGTQAGFLFAILENTEQIALEFFAEIAIIFGSP